MSQMIKSNIRHLMTCSTFSIENEHCNLKVKTAGEGGGGMLPSDPVFNKIWYLYLLYISYPYTVQCRCSR